MPKILISKAFSFLYFIGLSLTNGTTYQISPVTVICGNQATGKSTIAKLYSIFSWLEKANVKSELGMTNENIDDLVSLCKPYRIDEYFNEQTEIHYIGTKESQEELFCSSTLLFYYLAFAAMIKDDSLYNFMYKKISENFSKTDIQFWFPDSSSDDYIYNKNAGYTSGFSFVCSPIPNSISEMEKLLNSKRENEIGCKDFSCFQNSFTDLLFISNRFFRTPIIPDSLLCIKSLLDMIQNKTQNS